MLLGISGNSLVIFVLIKKGERNATNCYIVNLAIQVKVRKLAANLQSSNAGCSFLACCTTFYNDASYAVMECWKSNV